MAGFQERAAARDRPWSRGPATQFNLITIATPGM
jgi:hypothetical protein